MPKPINTSKTSKSNNNGRKNKRDTAHMRESIKRFTVYRDERNMLYSEMCKK